MTPALLLVGAISIYAPGDGHNAGELACGGRLTWRSEHVAIRGWRGRCGAPARVCVRGRCAWTTVRDSGPWGLQCGPRWHVWTRPSLPAGCRRRAVVDLAWALWQRLGRPPFLSRAEVTVYRRARPAARGGEM